MTLVQIKVADVLGRAPEYGDKIIFRTKRIRGSDTNLDQVLVPREQVVPLVSGVAEVEVDPGSVLVQFRCGTSVDTNPIEVAVPRQDEPVSLRALLEGVFQYEEPVVSAVTRLVEEARRITSVLGSAEQIRAWTESSSEDAAAADASAAAAADSESVAVAKAGEADASAQAAKASETAAKASETAAKSSETAAKASETAAAGSASAAASDRAAAGVSATAAKSSETAAKQSETSASSSATAAADARDSAQAYAGGAQTQARAAQVEADKAAASAQQAAATAASGVPDATTSAKGKVQLAGDLAGTADAPTVPGLATKANASHSHAIGDVTNLQSTLDSKAPASHTHTIANVTGLQSALDGKANASNRPPVEVVSTLPANPVAGTLYLVQEA